MDTEKAWEEFQANDSSIRKSESVQQDIQQILDTVTQIKTDVDQLKAEGPKATGPVDEEPSLSAPEEAAPALEPEAEPQAPMGDLMAQPEDGAATPTPEEPMAEAPAEDVPPLFAEGENPFAADAGEAKESDEDRLLKMAMELDDPELKQQVIALAYQAIEAQKMPPAPPMEPAPEEILAAAMDANGDGMLSEEEIEPMMRSADATETVKCDANPADAIKDKPSETVAMSDDEDKEEEKEESDEKKDDDDKSERPEKEEPGVNDELPEGEEDKDSLEELPEVTEVKIETEEQTPEETEEEKGEAIESIIDSILEEAKERIKDQVIEATEGIDAEHSPFLMSTKEMMKSYRSGKRTAVKESEPIRKSIDWPEDVKSLDMEDKCRFFAKSFSQMDEKMQDSVVTLMDTALGSDATSSIFKSEGVDLDKFYEPVVKAAVSESNLDNQPTSDGISVTGDKKDNLASDATEGVATTGEKKSEAVQKCSESVQDSVQPEQETQTLEACKKSADVPEGVGMHIPTVSEMMAFKKSGTSMYTSISREAAEPHGMVRMDDEPEIPSVKDMFAKRFGS